MGRPHLATTLLQAWGVTTTPRWNVPSWSISAEWFACLLFPLLAPALIGVRERAIVVLELAVAALAATALLFTIADWTLNTWVPPALTRVFGEFLCGAALCPHPRPKPEYARPSGDILATGAFLAFLFARRRVSPILPWWLFSP